MTEEACCTCARLLYTIAPPYDEKSTQVHRRLACCGRTICTECLGKNKRFHTYCPYCQISSTPSSIPAQGLREPPAYSASSLNRPNDGLPAYNDIRSHTQEKASALSEDILHFVDPTKDSISSLSLAYGVPQEVLRRRNHFFDDKLLLARRTILIPGEYCKSGVSLSPAPIESEEESIRKSKIRRWMITTKNADYDMALLYLKQTQYDLDAAVMSYLEDEKWEREHPLSGPSKGKLRTRSRGARAALS